MNRKRKFQQIKAYSRIMKIKRDTGQVKECKVPSYEKIEQEEPEEKMKMMQEKREELNDEDFEDQFSDEFEQQEAWVSDHDNDSEAEQEDDGTHQSSNQMQQQPLQANKNKRKSQEKVQIFTGTNKSLKKDEVLDFDNNAYEMLHRLNTQWPSLSIDFVCQDNPFMPPKQFQAMNSYPYQVYTVQGSSNNTKNNSIYFTKWFKLHKTKFDSDPDAVNEDENENVDEDPEVIVQEIPTTFNINRLKTLKNSPIVALWNEAGQINILDLTQTYQKLQSNIGSKKKLQKSDSANTVFSLKSKSQGFSLSWNPLQIGQLATGNCSNQVQIFQNNQNYTSWHKTHHYTYHTGSVQDIVFSPAQPTVFGSCSSDGTLQIVDMRVGELKRSQIKIKAHSKDVNVCDWNQIARHLIVTGSDDCSVKVWDLRMCNKKNQQNQSQMCEELLAFKWHNEPITSIKFQPNDQSTLAVASQDNSISIWDMSVENQQEDPQIPNQLMFIHQGQEQIKEICFHPVYYEMMVSSALDGINIFKPSYQMPQIMQEGQEDLSQMQPIKQTELDEYLERMNLND